MNGRRRLCISENGVFLVDAVPAQFLTVIASAG